MVDESTQRSHDAKNAFNAAWDLIDAPHRTDEQNREMIVKAMASRFLWSIAADPADESTLAVGDWQISHVLSLVGSGELALLFARAALQRAEANAWEDWRLASCHEGMARAHGVLGNHTEKERHANACRYLLSSLDADDRAVIEGQLGTI
jgi:hypothetical protein